MCIPPLPGKYFGLDHEQFESAVTKDCIKSIDDRDNAESILETEQEEHEQTFHQTYNPFDLHMGQMTVYRLHISCACKNVTQGRECAKILPLKDQPWSGYMGSRADSYFLFSPMSFPTLRMREGKKEKDGNKRQSSSTSTTTQNE